LHAFANHDVPSLARTPGNSLEKPVGGRTNAWMRGGMPLIFPPFICVHFLNKQSLLFPGLEQATGMEQRPKEITMTTPTMIGNGRLQRKTLSSQIDRLDGLLDGLAENLNDAVAQAVRDTVAQVVREAVEGSVKEVLSNPELLRVALAQHTPALPPAQPTPEPRRRSFSKLIQSGWIWLGQKVAQTGSQVQKKLGQGLSWCKEKLHQGWSALWNRRNRWIGSCVGTVTALATVGLALWQFRWSCAIALTAGLIAGVSGYCAGPLLGALISGLGGMALALSTLILLPLWNLLRSCTASTISE
jgi:hypothetical protein